MSQELDDIDDKLSQDEKLKNRQSIKRNKVLMDFNLLDSENPAETNRTVFKAIVIISILAAAYLVSFYI